MYGRFDRASRNRGAVFLSTFLFAPPELHETGTVLKHWNRATEYVKTMGCRLCQNYAEVNYLYIMYFIYI